MGELQIGQKVRLNNGAIANIRTELGRGGQGVVYLVEVGGKNMALKWYLRSPGNAFYRNLTDNIRAGAPAPNFIWPLAVTETIGDTFGYVMAVRPNGYEDMGKFILAKAKFADVNAQLRACLQICSAFQKLHIKGLSYQDMNDGNFFINPMTGDVLICDNDNVAPDGTNMGILGKAGYMAPEIVEGVKRPNKYTDYYSLAVCLFILIYMNRPFEGKWYMSCPCDNNPVMAKKLFGFNSVFIMDPTNDINRPVPGVHNNVLRRWNFYPSFLKDQFCKTFSAAAIKDSSVRLMDKQWYKILLQVRSMYAKCPNCGKETFIDISGPNISCIFCHTPIQTPDVLEVGKFRIPLVEGQSIYSCMVSDDADIENKVGRVIKKDGLIGLENNSDTPWTVMLPDGRARLIEKGHGAPSKKGFKIRFGQNETGEIK